MIGCILFIPFLSFCVCTIFSLSRGWNERGGNIFIISIMILFNLVTFNFFLIYYNSSTVILTPLTPWFNLEGNENNWCLMIDNISCIMMVLIVFVSSMVHFYSLKYMVGEAHLFRFMGYLGLFTFFMLLLIFSQNCIQLFVGWEGVGICSYLLISFWYNRLLASQSAFKAMLLNKIGDIAFIIALGFIYKKVGSFNLGIINYYFSFFPSTLIAVCFSLAVMGKSAQIGLHLWLPDAMEGPTPVSALIHAATMVTAGIFLMIKISPLFYSNNVNILLLILGSLTCFIAANIGINQTDLKKIIAYSTCSQLGYMTLVCGYGYYNTSLFHLFNHGIFKALLFLSAGLIIHTGFNEQFAGKMGFKNQNLLGKYALYLGGLAIIGFPFFTGYYSKDLFLELCNYQNGIIYPLWLGYLAACFTCFYSLKTYYASYNTPAYYASIFNKTFHNSPFLLIFPCFILSSGSIMGGYFFNASFIQPISPLLVNQFTKIIPLILTGIIFIQVFKNIPFYLTLYSPRAKKIFLHTWYFNEILTTLFLPSGKIIFHQQYKLIDNQVIEFFSATGIISFSKILSSVSNLFYLKNITLILKSLIISLIIIIFFIF